MQLVGKAPIRNEFLASVFKPGISSTKENGFYTEIIPALQRFQMNFNVTEEEQLDVFVRCFGARHSLDPKKREADGDALLLLENIKFLGFKIGDRKTGFSAKASMQILAKLAQFHALGIAFRLLRPQDFGKEIRPFLQTINFYEFDMSISRVSLNVRKESVSNWIFRRSAHI